MRMKSFVFLFVFAFVLPSFSATSTRSGSGSLTPPKMAFKSWCVGRSPVGTNINSQEQKSFITSTETECWVEASVVYDGNQGDSVSPIDPSTVKWTVIDSNPSNMALDTSSVKKNWSDKHPSKFDASTSFNVVGKLNVPVYQATAKPFLCRDENNHRRHERTPTHRGDTKLAFTIKFTADTEDGQRVEKTLTLAQAEVRHIPVDKHCQKTLLTSKIIVNVGLSFKEVKRSQWDAESQRLKETDSQ